MQEVQDALKLGATSVLKYGAMTLRDLSDKVFPKIS